MIYTTTGRKERESAKLYLTEAIGQQWEVRLVYVSVGGDVENHDDTYSFRRCLPSWSSFVD